MGMKFRRSFFGYKKADVYDYIRAADADFAEEIREKKAEIEKLSCENSALKEKYEELNNKREIIVSVLEKAHMEADSIVKEAKKDAGLMREEAAKYSADMRKNAEEEIEEKKLAANREIELKRRAIRNMYEKETRSIEHLRDEVSELRQSSLEAIRMFERELGDIEMKLGYKEDKTLEAVTEMKTGKGIEPFKGVKIPIKVIKRKTDVG